MLLCINELSQASYVKGKSGKRNCYLKFHKRSGYSALVQRRGRTDFVAWLCYRLTCLVLFVGRRLIQWLPNNLKNKALIVNNNFLLMPTYVFTQTLLWPQWISVCRSRGFICWALPRCCPVRGSLFWFCCCWTRCAPVIAIEESIQDVHLANSLDHFLLVKWICATAGSLLMQISIFVLLRFHSGGSFQQCSSLKCSWLWFLGYVCS